MLKYNIVGLKKLQAAVKASPGVIATQEAIALRSSVTLVRRLMMALIPLGPGHFGYHLLDRWRMGVKVQLNRSVGLLSTDAPQGRWLETGTKPHDILPSRAQALAIHGVIVSAVHHPGEKARHGLRNSYRAALPAIRGYFDEALRQAAKSMATSGD